MQGIDAFYHGLILFFAVHLLAGLHEFQILVSKTIGKTVHRILHSMITLFALYLITIGFTYRPLNIGYELFDWGYWVPVVTMPFSMMLLAGAFSSDIKRITRHPMLWAIVIFAASHLFANNDLGTIYLFGSFLAYGFIAMFTSDRKMRLGKPEKWAEVSAKTSIFPFLAIIQGKTNPPKGGAGRFAIGLGILLYVLLAFLHPFFTGMAIQGFYI